MTETKRAARTSLSRERVVDQALAVADAEGIGAVTIRRLATDLGVTPMALYWHFKTKDELLAGAADRLLDDVVVPEPTGDWAEHLRAAMTAVATAMQPHPQVAPLVLRQMLVHPTGLELSERMLADLSAAGFDPDAAGVLAVQALRSAVTMVTAEQVDATGRSAAERAEAMRAKQARLAALPADRYPALVAHASALAWCTAPTYLGVGIDVFVAGVRGLAPSTD